MRIHVPDSTLNVREQGTGRPVVLAHGGTGTGNFDWAPVLPALADRFRVVVLDLRGHGGSPAPGWRIGIHRYGLDIAQVMRTLGMPRAALIGFSAGANSVITLLARRPRLAVGAVLVGASMTSEPDRIDEILTGPWPEELKALRHDAADDPDHWRLLRAALARDWVEHNSFTRDTIGRITAPVLVVHGSNDRIVDRSQAEGLVAALPAARLWMADGARHMVQRDQPEAFLAEVIPFLETLPW